MNRFWIGAALLAVFLGASIWITTVMFRVHGDISETMDDAARQMLSGDTEEAMALAQQARQSWQKYWRATACVTDHASMDEIDGIFAKIDVYAKTNREAFAASCARVAVMIHAVGEAHSFNWWNLL